MSLFYDQGVRYSLAHRQQFDDVISRMGVTDHLKVLDAGCGTGAFEDRLCQLGQEVRVIGLDLSWRMLKQAVSKDYGCLCAPMFCQCSLDQPLPIIDSSVDCVVCINTLFSIASRDHILNEFCRVLKDDGSLLVVDPIRERSMSVNALAHQYFEVGKSDKTEAAKLLLHFIVRLPVIIIILTMNQLLNVWALKGEIKLLKHDEVAMLLEQNDFGNISLSTTMAGQCWIASSQKKASNKQQVHSFHY